MRKFELAIIGAGPAGITSAIYAKRAGLDIIICDPDPIGGLITHTNDLENYPGFPEAQSGMDLMMKFQDQLKSLDHKIENIAIEAVVKSDGGYILKSSKEEIFAKTIIVATGSKPKKLGIPNEDEYVGRGISYCATCDGPLFRDKKIAIVGTGNSGIQEGTFLLKFVKHISFIEMLPYMIAEKILQDRVKKHDNVEFYLGHKIVKLQGEPFLESIILENIETKEQKTVELEGIFVFIGYDPKTNFLKDVIELDRRGYVIADNDTLETSAPGIYVAGDVRQKKLRQVVTAASDGAIAVFSAQHYLDNLDS